MFLRATKRIKDGKAHQYWSLVESVRSGRRVFQWQALYLGELNDSQLESGSMPSRRSTRRAMRSSSCCSRKTARPTAATVGS